ncbi:hypothetical protein PIB30_049069 [Stylosanthes scabra]|uniref:Uncharacterized protein n=1 Tax=Stylosanthes scabra TaxID=79078 RepID=A0ABU6XEY5_9FABA|nr:hypothetical protein [Stylosanthes scabra]
MENGRQAVAARLMCGGTIGYMGGSKVDVWRDNWIHGLSKPIGDNNHPKKVMELLTEEGEWDRIALQAILPNNISSLVLRIPVGKILRNDSFNWPFRKDGEYPVKTGYHIAKKEENGSTTNQASTSNDHKELWKKQLNMLSYYVTGQGQRGLAPKSSAPQQSRQPHH